MTTQEPTTRLTATTFRKIELQSPSDLHYLEAQTQRAARQKIDVAFPPSAAPANGEEDGMRRRVEELVQEFVERTWEGVRENVTVNGCEMGEGEGGMEVEEFEPLDAKLAERIRVLEAEKERLTLKVTGLRREGPAKAAENFQVGWRRGEEGFDAQMVEREQREGESGDMQMDVGELKRWQDVVGAYEKSMDGLVGLKTDLTETVARLERAKGVATYMEGQGS